MRQNLLTSPTQSNVWQNAYPYMSGWSLDYKDTENPDFIANPSQSKISGNITIHYKGDSVFRYSDISGNNVYRFSDTDKLFENFEAAIMK